MSDSRTLWCRRFSIAALSISTLLVEMISGLGVTAAEPVTMQPVQWQVPTRQQLNNQCATIALAMNRLDQYLSRSSYAENWRQYLLWNDLVSSIGDDVDNDQELQIAAQSNLMGVYNRLADDQAGLERQQFRDLRTAIRVRIRQLNAVLFRDGQREASARIARLAILAAQGSLSGEAQDEWGMHVSWLSDHLQPIPTLNRKPHQANFVLDLSAPLIRDATITPVSDPTDVNECIVGARVIGSGVTTGAGWLSLAPSAHGARLIANFSGTMNSDTIGYSGPVRVYSDGRTQLRGTAELRMTETGLRHVASSVHAAADSSTKGISTKFKARLIDGLVKRIATKEIAKKKGAANRESAIKAEASFRQRFAKDIEQQVSEGDASFQKLIRLPWSRRDLFPSQWDWSSQPSGLNTAMRYDGRSRPSAFHAPPLTMRSTAVRVAIHQSMINNAAEGYLAGRLLDLGTLIKSDSDKSVPDYVAQNDAAQNDVAIRLDDFQPVRCVFDDDQLAIQLLGRQFIAGGTEYPAAVISIRYAIARDAQGWHLARIADPTILPTPRYARPPRFGLSGAALKAAVQPVLSDELPSRIPLEIPTIDADVPSIVKELKIVDAFAIDGWLCIGLDR